VGGREGVVGCVLAAVAFILWSIPALDNVYPLDVGLAYKAGQVAWSTGHPEHVQTWISTPFLGMVMALVSRIFTVGQTGALLTVLNIALLIGLTSATWWVLRDRIPRWLWWVSIGGAAVFAPAVSTIWWKQFNIVALALVVAGFCILRLVHRTPGLLLGALIIALSISIKPVAILVPVALLLRRESFRAGIMCIVWTVVLQVIALGFLSERAHSLAVLSPLPPYRTFSARSQPANIWVCHPENFSPQSIMCRVGGDNYWTAQRVAVLAGVLLIAYFAYSSVRSDSPYSWRWFAYACAITPMVGPIAWSHYQIMLAPLFVVLLVEFAQSDRMQGCFWVGLAAAFLLAELVWRPNGTLPGVIDHFFTGRVETTSTEFTVFAYAALAQFVIVGVAIVCFFQLAGARAGASGEEDGRPEAARLVEPVTHHDADGAESVSDALLQTRG